MGSADWMNRNLHSRIEVCFPLYDKKLCNEIGHILDLQLSDNSKAVIFTTDLENVYTHPSNGQVRKEAQQAIYEYVRRLAGYREPSERVLQNTDQ